MHFCVTLVQFISYVTHLHLSVLHWWPFYQDITLLTWLRNLYDTLFPWVLHISILSSILGWLVSSASWHRNFKCPAFSALSLSDSFSISCFSWVQASSCCHHCPMSPPLCCNHCQVFTPPSTPSAICASCMQTTGYTFTPCVGSLSFPWLLVSLPKECPVTRDCCRKNILPVV